MESLVDSNSEWSKIRSWLDDAECDFCDRSRAKACKALILVSCCKNWSVSLSIFKIFATDFQFLQIFSSFATYFQILKFFKSLKQTLASFYIFFQFFWQIITGRKFRGKTSSLHSHLVIQWPKVHSVAQWSKVPHLELSTIVWLNADVRTFVIMTFSCALVKGSAFGTFDHGATIFP